MSIIWRIFASSFLLAGFFIFSLIFTTKERQNSPSFDDDDREHEQKDRLAALNRACNEFSAQMIKGRKLIEGLVLDPDLHVAYCHIPKAASTWWLNVFAKRLNINVQDANDDLHRLLLRRNNSATAENDSFNFIFVRHPLARIISAYVNKIVNGRDDRFIKPLARFIRRRNRNPPGQELELNFGRFAEFVLDEVEKERLSFGSYHWMPMHKMCAVCRRKYDFIGKVETMRTDVDYLKRTFPGLGQAVDEVNVDGGVLNRGLSKSGDAKTAQKYLNQLDFQLKRRLCEAFKIDLAMFAYDCDIL